MCQMTRPLNANWKLHRCCYERSPEPCDVCPRRAVLRGIRNHREARSNERSPFAKQAGGLPNAWILDGRVRLARLCCSVRRCRPVAAVTVLELKRCLLQ